MTAARLVKGAMAKKRNGVAGKPDRKPGRPPVPEDERSTARVSFRVSPAWKDWWLRFARFARKDQADLFDEAAEKLAELKGFTEKPPKR